MATKLRQQVIHAMHISTVEYDIAGLAYALLSPVSMTRLGVRDDLEVGDD